MSDAAHYRDNLAGKAVPLHEGAPMPGYYKMRRGKGTPFLPVAVWSKDGKLVARVGSEMADPQEIWVWCCDNPVSKADAKHAFETGSWPGDVPSIGHNAEPDETLAQKIARIAKDAIAWLRKSGITDGVSKNLAANYRDQLNTLKKEADTARDAEKRPHIEAGRAIDAHYKPLIDEADQAAKELRDALTVYMRAEYEAADKIAVAARKAAEAAAKREAEKAGLPAAELPLPVVEPPKTRAGGQYGKQTSLRTKTTYVIADYEATLAHVKDHADVQAAVMKVATAMARAGAKVPGVETRTEKVAA